MIKLQVLLLCLVFILGSTSLAQLRDATLVQSKMLVTTRTSVRFQVNGHWCQAGNQKEKPFFEAVRNGRASVADALLKKGKNPNITDDCGIPFITYASNLVHLDWLKILVKAEADVIVFFIHPGIIFLGL